MTRILDRLVNEEARLNALRDLRLLDSPPSESFDRLTRLASRLLDAPVSTISLTDRDRQWFKSKVGVDLTEIPREQAPCAYAIEGDGVFVVPDLNEDERFVGSPLAQSGIRFYAGAPLFTRQGHGLGTLCVVDEVARDLREGEGEVLRDLANMVMSQIELQNLVGRVDAATGEPNQFQLFEDIDNLAGENEGDAVSLLSIDVLSKDQMTSIIQVMGGESLGILMQQAIARLRSAAGNRARAYHVDTVRCALLVQDSLIDTLALSDRIREVMSEVFHCDLVPIAPEVSIGIYEFAVGEVLPRDALRRAGSATDDALHVPSGQAMFSPASEQRNARRFAMLNNFSDALAADDQLSLVYQPRVKLSCGTRCGAEALLRWSHPSLGAISPGEFVPLVEQTALSRPMTDWVLRRAMSQLEEWREDGYRLPVAINASAMNLEEEDFAKRLLELAQKGGIDPATIELEFTESALARDPAKVIGQLNELKNCGVTIAIDDFGTGYSNLSYMQKLPASVLKIDRAFVCNLLESGKDRLLVKTIIAMGHDLGYRVVAEGIETQDVFDLLAEWGCDEGQGYLISHPVMPEALFNHHSSATMMSA